MGVAIAFALLSFALLVAAVYLALAAVMVWVGLYTNWTFGRR